MPMIDQPPEGLREHRPGVAEPADFDDFWERTLDEARAASRPAAATRVDSPIDAVEVWDVSFSGFGGDPIGAWLLLPASGDDLPGVVEFLGYGGGRGLPHEHLAWAACGYAHLVMDTRGQGSGWGSGGDTPDPHGAGPAVPGYMTRGIEDPSSYYYRRLVADAVRAVETMRGFARVDASRVAVCGTSQGGGLAIAAAGLVPGLVAAMPNVPFLCHFERAVLKAERGPYPEIVRYLAVHRGSPAQVFETLSYVDGVNFARRATAPALFSAALMDQVCPPSTVYAARNAWGGRAEIVDYPFNDHEGGEAVHWERQARFLAERVAGAAD